MKPITFNDEMINAILEGRKNQTRRPFKGTTEYKGPYNPAYMEVHKDSLGWKDVCSYGKVGDKIWVRESWGVGCRPCPFRGDYEGIEYKAECKLLEDNDSLNLYEVNVPSGDCLSNYHSKSWKRPSSMPEWASRITLEITNIRVEKVQDITPEDAIREGYPFGLPEPKTKDEYIDWFRNVWDKIYAKKGFGWNENPYCWVIEFKVLEGKK